MLTSILYNAISQFTQSKVISLKTKNKFCNKLSNNKNIQAVTPLHVVKSNTALKLRAEEDFDGKIAGDEWLFKGPGKQLFNLQPRLL